MLTHPVYIYSWPARPRHVLNSPACKCALLCNLSKDAEWPGMIKHFLKNIGNNGLLQEIEHFTTFGLFDFLVMLNIKYSALE